ncbi:outer membrane immunogenic protein [Nitrobacteraceae bacterium AZCC 2146]
MKHITLAATGLALIALSSAATAADMSVPSRVYTKAPVLVDPGYNWTGFYAGLNGGYSWGRTTATVIPTTPLAAGIGHDVDGALGGGQIGYNWQIDKTWVLGLEADIQGTGERGRSADALGPIRAGRIGIAGANTSTTDFPWFATFRGRVGILADPSLLLYGTGGLAVGEVKFGTQTALTAQFFDGNTPIGTPITAVGPALWESQTRVGWTAGAGMEKKFSPNWSAKLEYLYLDFGSKTYFGGTADETRVSFHDHVFRAGFNYAFSPAVVAKY